MNLLYLSLFITLVHTSVQHVSHDHHPTHEDKNEHNGKTHTKALEDICQAHLQFSVSLFRHIASSQEKSPKNIFFSPFSISTAFSMLSLGAKSETHKQILEGLSLNETRVKEEEIHEAFEQLILALNKPKSDLQVNIGNAVFVQENLNLLKTFADQVEHYYRAEILSTDFSNANDAEKKINDYVKKKTEGKIEELVKDLDDGTKLVLLNYIFFKGEWENKFNPSSTRVSNFFVDGNTTVKVQMMSRIGSYKIYQDDQLPCLVLQLPYKNNASMLVVIPEMGKIREVEEALSVDTIKRWKKSAHLRFTQVHMPKFSISSSVNLKEVLSDMGIKDAFSNKADFSGISQDARLVVTKAVHKAVLDVHEKGTEAAGATAIEIMPMSILQSHKVNRPFILLICSEETDSIFFMGRVTDPTAK
ncbi:serine protease inhibitor A6 [Bombina bombina]|uniref:serine protease inhibitor A6 n=1 Tax=Bombina bombina TaxID=8345 RepID=UPI00235A6F82|nr:serine protease inhibitor A6 [Bombina bombina]